MITKIKGELEIDHRRGVIYFHTADKKICEQVGSPTVLRICSLPTPIPTDQALDVTHLFGASWHSSPMRMTNAELVPTKEQVEMIGGVDTRDVKSPNADPNCTKCKGTGHITDPRSKRGYICPCMLEKRSAQ